MDIPKPRLNYWFNTKRSLEKRADAVEQEFNCFFRSDDYENVYEWSEQKSGDGYYVNISRKHTITRSNPSNPLIIFFEKPAFKENEEDLIGEKLKKCLKNEIKFGIVKNVQGDEFVFEKIKIF